MQNNLSGFTLIELLIAIAIVGILTSISFPSYQRYTKKAHYLEIINATIPFKIGIEECFQITGKLKNCQAGKNGVPPNIESGQGYGIIENIRVTTDGKIVATPREAFGIKPQDTYVATPIIKNNQLTWQTSEGEKK